MAQHIPIGSIDNKVIQRIERGIRNQLDFKGSLIYEEIYDEAYKEGPLDKVFLTTRMVPSSLVAGGRVTIEVHTKPRKGFGQEATNIYLVA